MQGLFASIVKGCAHPKLGETLPFFKEVVVRRGGAGFVCLHLLKNVGVGRGVAVPAEGRETRLKTLLSALAWSSSGVRKRDVWQGCNVPRRGWGTIAMPNPRGMVKVPCPRPETW